MSIVLLLVLLLLFSIYTFHPTKSETRGTLETCDQTNIHDPRLLHSFVLSWSALKKGDLTFYFYTLFYTNSIDSLKESIESIQSGTPYCGEPQDLGSLVRYFIPAKL